MEIYRKMELRFLGQSYSSNSVRVKTIDSVGEKPSHTANALVCLDSEQ